MKLGISANMATDLTKFQEQPTSETSNLPVKKREKSRWTFAVTSNNHSRGLRPPFTGVSQMTITINTNNFSQEANPFRSFKQYWQRVTPGSLGKCIDRNVGQLQSVRKSIRTNPSDIRCTIGRKIA